MERSGPPADLSEDYAIKTPMAVICELLGGTPKEVDRVCPVLRGLEPEDSQLLSAGA